jgi:hypothetical protein
MNDTPSLPFGLNVGQVITLGGVLIAFVGSIYVQNYKLNEIETGMGEFRKVVLEHQQVLERQNEYGRRLNTLEERLNHLEERK